MLCCEIAVFCAKKNSMGFSLLAFVLLTGLWSMFLLLVVQTFSVFGNCFLSFKKSVKQVSKTIELDSSGGIHVIKFVVAYRKFLRIGFCR